MCVYVCMIVGTRIQSLPSQPDITEPLNNEYISFYVVFVIIVEEFQAEFN